MVATLLRMFSPSQYKAMAKATDQIAKVSLEVDTLYSDETNTMLAEDVTFEQIGALQQSRR